MPVVSWLAFSVVNPLPLPVNVFVPILTFPKPLVMLPESSAPTVVKALVTRLLSTMLAPRDVASKTMVSAILYALLLTIFSC